MNSFLNSTYDEARRRSVNSSNTSRINQELLRVLDNCQQNYFATLRDRVRLTTLVEPNGYDTFVVQLDAYIPDETETDFIIRQIEPANLVSCTENGTPLQLNKARRAKAALLTCTKNKDQAVRLLVRTNAGTSSPLPLPSEPPPKPAESDDGITAIVWTARQSAPSPPREPCSCIGVSPSQDEMEQMNGVPSTISLQNNCRGAVTLDVGKYGQSIGDLTATFTLEPDEVAVLEMNNADGGGISPRNCPAA